jgi:hypothetical protein
MTTTQLSEPNTDIHAEDYLLIGLATCFYKEDGEVYEIQVMEPIPSAALEAIMKGIPTSYKFATAIEFGSVMAGDELKIPVGFPEDARFGDEFSLRAIAAARTYKARPQAQQHIPLGTSFHDFNYSVERKRVLNAARVVLKEDNVKQHSHTHKVL